MSASTVYVRFELLRTARNFRFMFFSVAFPVVMFLLLAGGSHDKAIPNGGGATFAEYYMVGLAAWGAMIAALSVGGRISAERHVGWNRQLRITPLSQRSYLRGKVLTGYMSAAISLVLLYVAGLALGARMPASDWLQMTGLIAVALIPFIGLGITLGHLLSPDAMGPAMGAVTGILAFLGGTWFPLPAHGFLHYTGEVLPSYWLVQAGQAPFKNDPWGTTGWVTIALWSVAMIGTAAWAYRRDTKRT